MCCAVLSRRCSISSGTRPPPPAFHCPHSVRSRPALPRRARVTRSRTTPPPPTTTTTSRSPTPSSSPATSCSCALTVPTSCLLLMLIYCLRVRASLSHLTWAFCSCVHVHVGTVANGPRGAPAVHSARAKARAAAHRAAPSARRALTSGAPLTGRCAQPVARAHIRRARRWPRREFATLRAAAALRCALYRSTTLTVLRVVAQLN